MKHLRKFNEEWIEDMYNDLERNRRTPEDQENMSDLNKGEEEGNQSDHSLQFRLAVRAASKNADPEAHQKMIDLLDKYGVDLIKDRRYIALKWAADIGKEEVMDVLLDKLKESGEDMDMIHKMLVPYASGSAWR